jgi:hypothetical protein
VELIWCNVARSVQVKTEVCLGEKITNGHFLHYPVKNDANIKAYNTLKRQFTYKLGAKDAVGQRKTWLHRSSAKKFIPQCPTSNTGLQTDFCPVYFKVKQ